MDGKPRVTSSRHDKASPGRPAGLRRGAPIGNRNRWVHGRRSRAEVLRRKQGAADRKAAAWALALLGTPTRIRPKPIRSDQIIHFSLVEMAMLRWLAVPGVVPR